MALGKKIVLSGVAAVVLSACDHNGDGYPDPPLAPLRQSLDSAITGQPNYERPASESINGPTEEAMGILGRLIPVIF